MGSPFDCGWTVREFGNNLLGHYRTEKSEPAFLAMTGQSEGSEMTSLVIAGQTECSGSAFLAMTGQSQSSQMASKAKTGTSEGS